MHIYIYIYIKKIYKYTFRWISMMFAGTSLKVEALEDVALKVEALEEISNSMQCCVKASCCVSETPSKEVLITSVS